MRWNGDVSSWPAEEPSEEQRDLLLRRGVHDRPCPCHAGSQQDWRTNDRARETGCQDDALRLPFGAQISVGRCGVRAERADEH